MRSALPLAVLCGALAACEAAPPSRAETAVATCVKHRITVGGRADPNPLPDTPDVAAPARDDPDGASRAPAALRSPLPAALRADLPYVSS